MNISNYLNNQFLIAMPNLADSEFSHTVSYLCEHNEEGALAIVVNRPMEMTLGGIFDQMNISCLSEQIKKTPVYAGGPVYVDKGFIIHSRTEGEWDSSISISDETYLTSSRDVLEAIAEDKGPKKYLVALGYAGWSAGQLEQEIINNTWLHTPYEESILYDVPTSQRWMMAANQIGVDITQLTIPAGHG
ncbi:MAG: YqgE/AlgH family protein [Methylococcales bacterium]|nr:YqgE/AlgH family protein [Methylococcales bacterium]